MNILTESQEEFLKVATTRMPYGKYKGSRLIDLPEPYVVWYKQNGFPPGKLGRYLGIMYEIKLNGLEAIVRKAAGIKWGE